MSTKKDTSRRDSGYLRINSRLDIWFCSWPLWQIWSTCNRPECLELSVEATHSFEREHPVELPVDPVWCLARSICPEEYLYLSCNKVNSRLYTSDNTQHSRYVCEHLQHFYVIFFQEFGPTGPSWPAKIEEKKVDQEPDNCFWGISSMLARLKNRDRNRGARTQKFCAGREFSCGCEHFECLVSESHFYQSRWEFVSLYGVSLETSWNYLFSTLICFPHWFSFHIELFSTLICFPHRIAIQSRELCSVSHHFDDQLWLSLMGYAAAFMTFIWSVVDATNRP